MQTTQVPDVRAIHRQGDTVRYIVNGPHATAKAKGLKVPRVFTVDGVATKKLTFKECAAKITDGESKTVFEQQVVDVPEGWSENAVNIVASKYFRGHVGKPDRETSIMGLIKRVVATITKWGDDDYYFHGDDKSANTFYDELTYMLATQMFAFNSPVWFNVGAKGEEHPQCSACFINSIEDSMESIMGLAAVEARLFKGGSGTGTNISPLRGSKEPLAGGGYASGPVSFMRGFDAFAGVIKSGGKTRRAAKMVILNAEHPDIMEFIECKVKEEKKAWALIDAGYDAAFTGEAYASVAFQNANHSIRVTDDFMQAALVQGGDWDLKSVKTGAPVETLKAKKVLLAAAQAAHVCGDPGVQFDTTINRWHTCKNTAPIYASNPCSEYMFLDDSACNLASLNLLKFLKTDHAIPYFDVEAFKHAVFIAILAQEIIVDNSSYPTAQIAQNSHDYRPLGLGYANLGALLMSLGVPYDSDIGRNYAAVITSIMHGMANFTSACIAADRGPFAGYALNSASFLNVMEMHKSRANIAAAHSTVPSKLCEESRGIWNNVLEVGRVAGFKNAQVTVLAPTGTIAFMMDCDTTGIEPDIALVKYKRLVGGGMLKIVNQSVDYGLKVLGYSVAARASIKDYIDKNETIEGSPDLKSEHLPVFDCAFRAKNGKRAIRPLGHINMMAAVQPFLSGAISKTVNVPEDTTPEQIFDLYVESWRVGLKAVAIYRDNCKRSQPLSTDRKAQSGDGSSKLHIESFIPERHKLPDDRDAHTHKFSISGHDGYLTTGFYPDGELGEIFVCMNKQGSTVTGLMDTIAILTSMALQYGVPLDVMVRRLSHMRFEPAGITGNKDIPIAKSIVDYIFRYLGKKHLNKAEQEEKPSAPGVPVKTYARKETAQEERSDAPVCVQCGDVTRRAGSCYCCTSCGTTTGCG